MSLFVFRAYGQDDPKDSTAYPRRRLRTVLTMFLVGTKANSVRLAPRSLNSCVSPFLLMLQPI